jgi:quercetin dioxygenase-like cupin family protein
MTFTDTADLAAREVWPGFHGKFVHTDGMTIAFWDIDAGAALPAHAHPHEQVSCVIEGQFEMTVGGETRLMTAGMVVTIPGDTPHSARALTVCRLVDVFRPVREDYR